MMLKSENKLFLIGLASWTVALALITWMCRSAAFSLAMPEGISAENQRLLELARLGKVGFALALLQALLCLESALFFLPKKEAPFWRGGFSALGRNALFLLPVLFMPVIFGIPLQGGFSLWINLAVFGTCVLFFGSHFFCLLWRELSNRDWFARGLTQLFILLSCGILFYANPLLDACSTPVAKERLINFIMWINPLARVAGLFENLDIVRLPFMYNYTEISALPFRYAPFPKMWTCAAAAIIFLLAIFAARLPRFLMERKIK